MSEKYVPPMQVCANRRYRIITFTLYQDSGVEIDCVQSILDASQLDYAISPLHDKDLTDNGKPKKPHYHVVIRYPGPVPFWTIASTLERLTKPELWYTEAATVARSDGRYTEYYYDAVSKPETAWATLYRTDVPQRVVDLRKMLCYLTHEDPASKKDGKHLYERDGVIYGGYMQAPEYMDDDMEDKVTILWEIMEFCDREQIIFYSDLLSRIRGMRNRAWQKCLMGGGRGEIMQYLKSREYMARTEGRSAVADTFEDPEVTGIYDMRPDPDLPEQLRLPAGDSRSTTKASAFAPSKPKKASTRRKR